MEPITIQLTPEQFCPEERIIVRSGNLSAAAFRFPGGVCGLRLANEAGELILLPFQGQQIWRATFKGVDLTMQSMFDTPLPTTDYLSTYGGFLIHCGMTAMGVPDAADSHPLHGELPNMDYPEASLLLDEDDDGPYIALRGQTEYKIAFSTHYRAEPEVRLHAGATVANVSLTVTNLRSRPLDYMYLCHINFRPVDGARLVYSAQADPQHVYAHMAVPDSLPSQDADNLRRYIEAINRDPSVHHHIDPQNQYYDPEIVMTLHYSADNDGYGHTLQVLPDGEAFYVAHRVHELPLVLRWIARTIDEDALGMALPATAEHHGRTKAGQDGQIKTLAGGSSVTMSMRVGYLDAAAAAAVQDKVGRILKEK
ncbi:MAG: DUF4432 family protein [Bacillota bacterium]|nr:DUF4432 family protein [Bacillota bacterium]